MEPEKHNAALTDADIETLGQRAVDTDKIIAGSKDEQGNLIVTEIDS